jgi:peptidyl-prolyl cis-trans isomerase SurA
VLPGFETGRQVVPFEEVAFALARPGDLSKPVRTSYGWHILKLIERRGIAPFADLAPTLRQRVTTDTRADVLRQSTIQRLLNEYVVTENKSVLKVPFRKPTVRCYAVSGATQSHLTPSCRTSQY